eukprot:TRINITY_DN34042_c0_g1_i1.p1 TRINITY_DN34042_c0_g1~~TRINITY_DN34042_c0_g1_i1.p1  ORF type:complete len:408 (+),score=64.58 TRINITY_DN34042_c0_g1_i1:66-1289(+)
MFRLFASARAPLASGASTSLETSVRLPLVEALDGDAAALQRLLVVLRQALSALDVRVLVPPPLLKLPSSSPSVGTSRAGFSPPLTVLFGARHDCSTAATQTSTAIHALRPSNVGVELCSRRLRRLLPFGVEAFEGLPEGSRASITSKLVRGGEQLAAVRAAHRVGAELLLCDRDIRTTEARLLASIPADVLRASAVASWGLPNLSVAMAWLLVALQLRRICFDGSSMGVHRQYTVMSPPWLGVTLPHEALRELECEAYILARDTHIVPRERWRRMRQRLDAMAENRQAARVVSVQATLDRLVQACIVHERDAILCDALWRAKSGPFTVAVVGIAHLDGMEQRWSELCSHSSANAMPQGNQAAAAQLDEVPLLRNSIAFSQLPPPWQVPLWKRILGKPFMWRLRGSFW